MEHILIVDDEESLVWSVSRMLRFHGYSVGCAANGLEALHQIQEQPPDLLLLDITMPGMDGLEVCYRLRDNARWCSLPIIFLTGRSDLQNKLTAFTAGADDYLCKPFEMHELVCRVRAVLRRTNTLRDRDAKEPGEPTQLQLGSLHLDLQQATVETEKGAIGLTPNELSLLKFFVRHEGQIFSSEALLQKVWGYPAGTGDPASVRWHIKNLRRKIEPQPNQPVYLRTVPHHGYMLADPASR